MNNRRLDPGLVVGVVALVFALAGSAVALPGKNKVDKNDIRKGAVKTKALKDGAVTQAKLKDGAVTAAKLNDGAVDGSKVADGSLGVGELSPQAVSELQGKPEASGLVSDTGQLSRATNVAAVDRPSTGVYCITPAAGIDPETAVMTVTPDRGDNGTNLGNISVSVAQWNSVAPTCPDGTLEVNTYLYDGDGTDNNDGGGNATGDDLDLDNEGFAFTIE